MIAGMNDLREAMARTHARKRVLENIWSENGGHSDEAFIQRAVEHAWRDYLPDADAALAAIEASGCAVVPIEPTEEMKIVVSEDLWDFERGQDDTDIYAAEIYRKMLAARPRQPGKGDDNA